MKQFVIGLLLATHALLASALQPYLATDKLAAGETKAVMAAAEAKLTGAGFKVVGQHLPPAIASHGVLVVTDEALTQALLGIGGTAVIGIPIRVGVKNDGTVSAVNLEYWLRAYLRKDYAKAENAVKATMAKLEKALGAGKPFGGEVETSDLPTYRYLAGMERFGDKAELKSFVSFDEAIAAVRDGLAKGVAKTAKVYELVYPEQKLAVFGVAMNDADNGEGWWVKKIGVDHIAALPWEIYVTEGKVQALYARYRTALAWPSLGMFQFMGISSHPDSTLEMLRQVVGAKAAAH